MRRQRGRRLGGYREGHEFHSCRSPLYMFRASAPEGLCLRLSATPQRLKPRRWEGVNRSGKPLRHPKAPQRLKPVEWRGLMARLNNSGKRWNEENIHFFRNLFSRAAKQPLHRGFFSPRGLSFFADRIQSHLANFLKAHPLVKADGTLVLASHMQPGHSALPAMISN